MRRQDDAVPGVSESGLELPADVAGEQVARDVRGPVEHDPRLTLTGFGSTQGGVKARHRASVRVLDRDVEPEPIVGRRAEQLGTSSDDAGERGRGGLASLNVALGRLMRRLGRSGGAFPRGVEGERRNDGKEDRERHDRERRMCEPDHGPKMIAWRCAV